MRNESTEEYAIFAKEQELIWHKEYDKAEAEFLKKVDLAIARGNSDDFCTLISNGENYHIYGNRPGYMVARLLYVMRMSELEHNSDQNILKAGQSLKTLLESAVTIPRFLLWRFELADDTNAASTLIDYLTQKGISIYAVCVLITTTSANIKKVFIQLSHIYLNRGDYRNSLILLNGLCDAYPNDPESRQLFDRMVSLVKDA